MRVFRSVQKLPAPRGLAIGFLIGAFAPLEEAMRKALPDFAIVTTLDGSPGLSQADVAAAHKAAGVPIGVPLIVFGWSAGCQPIRTGLMSGLFPTLIGVGCFDGTAAAFPDPRPDQIEVWTRLMDRARACELSVVLTCTSMTYTERLRVGPYMATRHVLERALGHELGEAAVIDRGLYVRRYPSLDCDAAAHVRQVREVLPECLPMLRHPDAMTWREMIEPVPFAAPLESPPAALSAGPSRLGELCVAWCRAELSAGVRETPPGSNRSPRIDQYFNDPDYTRGGMPLHVRGLAWCAAAQSMAHHVCGGTGPAFVSGIEFERWAETHDRYHDATAEPRVGWLAIFKRGAPGSWERHVTRVVEVHADETYRTIGGNEHDAWAEDDRPHPIDDPSFSCFVEI
jgi:hypothetical protein